MSYVETKLHRAWNGMKQRCNNPNNVSYHNYGGRGIKVCDEWQTFAVFQADIQRLFGVAEIPGGLSLDRIDNDGDYSPDNVRLTTRSEQQNNKRNNINLEYQGRIQTLNQWAVELGIHKATLRNRLFGSSKNTDELLMSIDEAFTKPVLKSASGCPGVSWAKNDRRWRAAIVVNAKRYNLGSFKNKAKAIAARKAAERTHGISA